MNISGPLATTMKGNQHVQIELEGYSKLTRAMTTAKITTITVAYIRFASLEVLYWYTIIPLC